MPDFSGASLRLSTSGDRETLAVLDRADQKAQALQKQFIITAEQSAAMWKKAQGSVHDFNQQVDEFIAKQQAAANAASQAVQNVATKVDAQATRFAARTTQMARGLEMVARTGRLTGRSMDSVFTAVGQMALGFGPSGYIVGSIAVGIGAMTEFFLRARREAEKTAEAFIDEMAKLSHAKDYVGITEAQQKIYSGDPNADIAGKKAGESDAQFLFRQQGLQGLAARARQLAAQIASAPVTPAYGNAGTGAGADPLIGQRQQLKEINDLIAQQGTEWTKLGELRDRLSQNFTDHARAELDSWRNKQHVYAEITDSQLTSLDKLLSKERPHLQLIGERTDLIGLLQQKEDALTYELEHGTPTYERRIQIEQEMLTTEKQLADAMTHTIMIAGREIRLNIKPVKINTTAQDESAITAAKKMVEDAKRMGEEIGRTFGESISAGISAIFQSGGDLEKGFDALTGSLLEGIGGMVKEVGERSLAVLPLIKTIVDAIANLNPAIGIPAALGLIALGSAMQAEGHSLGASASSRTGGGGAGSYGGSGGYYYGQTSTAPVVDRGYIDPTAHGPVTNPASVTARPTQINNFNIIGPDDPKAQRAITELVDKANRRRGR